MTLAVYPLVYLPVAASLRSADPARRRSPAASGSAGCETFWRVTLGQARGAILGGCLLVALVLLAEYGAFEILGYQTFTTEIFTEFNVSFNVPTRLRAVAGAGAPELRRARAARALARRGAGVSRTGPLAQRAARRHRLGRAAAARAGGLRGRSGRPRAGRAGRRRASTGCSSAAHDATSTGVSLLDAAWHTALYSGVAAALATLMALPVAMLAVRHRGRALPAARAQHLPGAGDARAGDRAGAVVLHRALRRRVPVPERAAAGRSPTPSCSSRWRWWACAPRSRRRRSASRRSARSLGRGGSSVLWRVTLPLIGPGLAAAFCLVFLSAVTELTATLILIPTGVQTLATQFWAYQQNLAYGQAAPFALAIIAIAAVPSVRARPLLRPPPPRAAVTASMSELDRRHRSAQVLRRPRVLAGLDLEVPGGLVHRHPRALGQRQDDAAAAARRLRARPTRGRSDRRAASSTTSALTSRPNSAGSATSPRREPVPAPHGRGEHRLRPAARRRAGTGRRAARARRPGRLGDALPPPALRRPAAARRAGARARDRARGGAAGRAVRLAGRAACAPSVRDGGRGGSCATSATTDAARDPRPGRGAVDRRPRGGAARGRGSPSAPPRRSCTPARSTASWRASSATPT